MISPKRTEADGAPATSRAIASGLLGGFGGFLSQRFRDHDFQLGRRNCQRFLMHVFSLPVDADIFGGAPPPPQLKGLTAAMSSGGPGVCLLPVVGAALPEALLPKWPQITRLEFETVVDRVVKRLDKVTNHAIDDEIRFWLVRYLLKLVLRGPLSGVRIRSWLIEKLRGAIEYQLVQRNQIEFEDPAICPSLPPQVSAVLAELINPNFTLRSAAGIAEATGIELNEVERLLIECTSKTYAPYHVWKTPWRSEGRLLYSSNIRKPGTIGLLLDRIVGRDHIGPLFSRPSIG